MRTWLQVWSFAHLKSAWLWSSTWSMSTTTCSFFSVESENSLRFADGLQPYSVSWFRYSVKIHSVCCHVWAALSTVESTFGKHHGFWTTKVRKTGYTLMPKEWTRNYSDHGSHSHTSFFSTVILSYKPCAWLVIWLVPHLVNVDNSTGNSYCGSDGFFLVNCFSRLPRRIQRMSIIGSGYVTLNVNSFICR